MAIKIIRKVRRQLKKKQKNNFQSYWKQIIPFPIYTRFLEIDKENKNSI